MNLPCYEDVLEAKKRIKSFINKTPVLTSKSINELTCCEIFFKCENFQKVGAFKFRGAANAVLSLTKEQMNHGVATHSSGNHAQALALAARLREIPATIVMPINSPKVKKDAVAGYGAEIVFCEPTLQAREYTIQKIIDKKGCEFIHPYDNYYVIAGQGTATMELLLDYPNLDILITPMGGGGLLSGSSISAKALSDKIKIIAAEPEGADDAKRSFYSGEIIPSENPKTICDGLLTSLSERTFTIIRNNVSDIITVSDEYVIKAMQLIWERMKIIIEPSSAICLGLIIEKKIDLIGKKIGIIISGGNVDLNKLPWQNK